MLMCHIEDFGCPFLRKPHFIYFSLLYIFNKIGSMRRGLLLAPDSLYHYNQ